MDVRRAHPDDADGCAAVVAAVAAEGEFLLTEPPVDERRLADGMRVAIQDGPDRIWVLVDEGVVVGTLGVHPTPATDVLALGMAVVGEVRGRGGGRTLVRAALRDADERGVVKVELEVFPANARAVVLYASEGFVVEGVRRAHYPRRDGSRRDVVVMARFNRAHARPGSPPPSDRPPTGGAAG